MQRRYWISGLAIVCGGLIWAASARSQGVPDIKNVMKNKLTHAQQVMEGVVTEDYGKIRRNTAALIAFTQQAEWAVMQNPEYMQYSIEFRRALEALAADADAKNIDAAALDYMQVTMSCINCHKYVRNAKRASR